MNKKLLLEVADAIEANPEHFDMWDWFEETDCGTTACIAGWALHLHKQNRQLEQTAQIFHRLDSDFMYALLGLNGDDFNSLTLINCWREPGLKSQYLNADLEDEIDSQLLAKIAAQYVRWFVENN